ncbi:MAG: PAS domain S-box protein [Flavobacteriaceae bacterium]
MKKGSKEELKKKGQFTDSESQWSKEIFQLLIESSGDMITLQDSDGMYTNYFGPSKYALSKDDLLGKMPSDLFDEVESKKIISAIKEVFSTGKSKQFVSHLDWEGKKKIFSEKVYPLFKNKKVVEVAKICTDITESFNTEIALKRSEERHELSLAATNDGIYDWNIVTNEIYFSPRWKSMLGYKENELPNDFSTWEELTDPEDAKKSWEMYNEMISKKRKNFELEFKMKHKEGHWVDILSRAICFFDKNGIANRIVGTHIDITSRLQKEREFDEYRAKELEEKNKELDNTLLIFIGREQKIQRLEKRIKFLESQI